MKELHDFRTLFASLVNTFPDMSWKSHKSSDGTDPFGGGWFIVGTNTPEGPYTYYFKNEHWDLFHCKELETAPEWDGHNNYGFLDPFDTLRLGIRMSDPLDEDVKRLLSLVSDIETLKKGFERSGIRMSDQLDEDVKKLLSLAPELEKEPAI